MENYEKLYKDALERAKDFMNDKVHYALRKGENIMCWIFPELRETEDEKIRKYLLKLAERCPDDSIDFMYEVKKEDVIAWLEKQGEKKTTWSEEDERMCNISIRGCKCVIDNFENSTWDYEDAIAWLKSLKNRVQPQWKPSEEQIQALDEVYKTHGANSVCRRIIFKLLEQLKKL